MKLYSAFRLILYSICMYEYLPTSFTLRRSYNKMTFYILQENGNRITEKAYKPFITLAQLMNNEKPLRNHLIRNYIH